MPTEPAGREQERLAAHTLPSDKVASGQVSRRKPRLSSAGIARPLRPSLTRHFSTSVIRSRTRPPPLHIEQADSQVDPSPPRPLLTMVSLLSENQEILGSKSDKESGAPLDNDLLASKTLLKDSIAPIATEQILPLQSQRLPLDTHSPGSLCQESKLKVVEGISIIDKTSLALSAVSSPLQYSGPVWISSDSDFFEES